MSKNSDFARLIKLISHDDVLSAFKLMQRCELRQSDQSGMTALHYCSYGKSCGVLVSAMVAQGARVNAKDSVGNTPLMEACLRRNFFTALGLITCGADLNIQNEMGESALSFACVSGHAQLICLLCEKGANLELVDVGGFKPRHYYRGDSKKVELALNKLSTPKQ